MPRTEIKLSQMDDKRQPTSRIAALLLAEDAPEKACAVLLEGLGAETPNRKPDYRNRRDAAMAILAYTEGRPVEMVYQITEKRTGGGGIGELLADPTARKALRAALDEAEGKPTVDV